MSPPDSRTPMHELPQAASAARPAGSGGTRRRRRWPAVLAVALVLLAALVVCAPMLAAPIVQRRIVAEANARLNGTTTLRDVSLSLGGSAHLSGLTVHDAEGRPVLEVPNLDVRAGLLTLLSGRVDADVDVRGAQVHLRREPDGRLNVQHLLREAPGAAPSAPPSRSGIVSAATRADADAEAEAEAAGRASDVPDAADGAPLALADLPELSGRLRVSGATVVLHEGGETTEVRELDASLDLEHLERPAPFRVTASLVGPGGPSGTLRLEGDVTAARDGLVDPARMRAHADYALTDGRLDGLRPAAALFAPVTQLAGGLTATGRWTWDGGLAVTGDTEIELAGPSVGTPALGAAPRALPNVRLVAQARLGADGAGTQTLRLSAAPLIDLAWDGTVAGAAGDAPEVGGTLTIAGRLEELQTAAQGLVPLRDDVRLSGALRVDARLAAALSPDGLRSASVDAHVGLTGLQAHEADGGKVNLGGLDGVDLALRADAAPAAGTLDLAQFKLQAGPVSAEAGGRVAGLPQAGAAFDATALSVADGKLAADADLGRLSDVLARVVDLGGTTMEGKLTVRATADGEAGAAVARFDVDVAGLHVRTPAPADAGAAPGEATELHVPSLTARGRASADAARVRVDDLVVAWQPLSAAGLELPAATVKADAAYAAADGAFDLERLELDSSLAKGGGRARVTGFGADAGPSVEGHLELNGKVEPWRALLAAFVPDLQPAIARGTFDLTLDAEHADGRSVVQPTLVLTAVGLDGYAPGGKPLPLPATDVHLAARAELEPEGEGRLGVPTITLRMPGLDLTAKAEVRGLTALREAGAAAADAPAIPPGVFVQVGGFWAAEPTELGRRLAVLLDGIGLSGERMNGDLLVRLADGRVDTVAHLSGPHVVLDLPASGETPARHLEQRDLAVTVDVGLDLGAADRLEVRTASYASRTARATLAGHVDRLRTPDAQAADLTYDVGAPLERVLADLGALLPLQGWTAEGALASNGRLVGDAGRLDLSSSTTVDKVRIVVPPGVHAPPGALPTEIADARWEIDARAAVDVAPLDVAIDHVDVRTGVLHGTLKGRALGLRALMAPEEADATGATGATGAIGATGSAPPEVARFAPLDGDFRYVPARLGALLSPWWPGTLEGEDEEPLAFHLEGPVEGFEPLVLLGSLSADATVGLGRLGLPPGLHAGGTVTIESEAGRAHVVGDLALNGGRVDLDARLDARPEPTAGAPGAGAGAGAGAAPSADARVSTLRLGLDAVQLNQELAAVLAHVHPLFAGGADAEVATVTGRLGGSLDVTWKGPLPLGAGTADDGAGVGGAAGAADAPVDWLALLGRSLSAEGRLQTDQLVLQASPLLSDMLGRVGVGSAKELSIAPVSFAIRDGRLAYAEPWSWRVSGVDTSFTGSVGLDLSLDLAWHVPVTEKLAEKHGFLKSMLGQQLTVPITGTVSAPSLAWDGVLKDLAEKAARAELEQRAKDKLGDLGGLLGGDKAGQGGAQGQAALSPEQLLAAADKLWDEGKRAEAKLLYQELLDKHKLTVVYALNKKRIKDRAED